MKDLQSENASASKIGLENTGTERVESSAPCAPSSPHGFHSHGRTAACQLLCFLPAADQFFCHRNPSSPSAVAFAAVSATFAIAAAACLLPASSTVTRLYPTSTFAPTAEFPTLLLLPCFASAA
ncbi:hypothetical protein ZIOFF_048511 [Zingiber officinale]|uniref:Uncharacterized protein n=1 Tax=Zingiber officinale TaxID=94328 RepID=A0A8J5KXP7_ZINOF|nr:hypothetical protein ZIOFF_048511 [Zingiber officinale]